MRIELATSPGDSQRPNEDYASVALPASGRGGVIVLLDGVTPPPGDDGCVHGVPWFTARLGGAMFELSGSRRDMTLADCLATAIARTADAHRDTCDLSHVRTPQATCVSVRWSDELAGPGRSGGSEQPAKSGRPDASAGSVEYLVLSDSALLVEHPDGTVAPLLDPRLDELPPAVRAQRDAVRAQPPGSAERQAAGAAYGLAVEALRNARGGFFTAAADPDVARTAVVGTLARTDVRALAALTDGATRWVEVFREGDWADCFALLRKEGPQALIDRVRDAEHADPDGAVFRRGKAHDDAAVVFAEF
ncbi:hypothetical protein [Streptomyces sp. H27-D2]|uniref:hypothetical protein n=1 Tax=Streptomyces sp. H27-D2 TaxID=3046304 RepID=UPI002DBA296D|nr:hypothetical protein [Streptomyces sp. H27-D2]MEC4018698.1 hypothetical protein [Streptomyces sp. H27-D2]